MAYSAALFAPDGDYVIDAISSDGRGHFLNRWDGEEHEFEHAGRYWYAYRS